MNAAEPYRLSSGLQYGPVTQTETNPALPTKVVEGKSAYEVAVESGFVGTEEEWLQSLKADGAYIYTQSIESGTWVINHNLNRLPDVSIYDALGREIDADVTASSTQVTIMFGVPMAGMAILT